MPTPVTIRDLTEADFARIHELDLSEHITLIYRIVDGRMVPEAHDWHRPPWDQAYWEAQLAEWRANLHPDRWFGAFEGTAFAGLASLRYELEPGLAQLTTLHVDHRHRRRGVAAALVAAVGSEARSHAATALYVSATESESAVGFYLSQGFRLADIPHPRQFELEPLDIHMVLPLAK